MVTTDVNEFAEAVELLRESADSAIESESVEDFSAVEQQINRLEGQVRSLRAALWSTSARRAAGRLEDGEPLTSEDLDAVRALLISDATHAVASPAHHAERVQEFGETLDKVMRCVHNPLDADGIAALHGAVLDMRRITPEIRRFLEEKHRVRQFEASLQSIDNQTRQMLAQILRERLADAGR